MSRTQYIKCLKQGTLQVADWGKDVLPGTPKLATQIPRYLWWMLSDTAMRRGLAQRDLIMRNRAMAQAAAEIMWSKISCD